jgi:hypothetical protein
MTRHIDAVALARFRDGDLSQARAARVSAHLARCGRCADLSAELASVTMLLASAQAPPIPDDLAARIRSTLAIEAARRAAAEPGTEPGRRDLPARSPGPRWRLPGLSWPAALRTLAAAGVIAVIAGGGYELIGGHPASTGHPAGSHGSAAGRAAAGRMSPAAGLGPKAAAPQSAFGPNLRYGRPGQHTSFVPVSTATDFRPASLTGQVSAALSQVRSTRGPLAGGSLGTDGTAAPSRSSQAAGQFGGIPLPELQACVTRIAAGSGAVLLVDIARYQGRPATVIVTMPSGGSARQVWVVGPACSGSRSDVLAQQLMPGG